MLESKNNFCFFHVATIGNYATICSEIFDYISKVPFNKVIVNIAGTGYVDLPNNIVVIPTRSNLEDFEFTTLNLLYDFSQIENGNICYVHTKGASTGKNICIDEWRQYMLHFNLNKYQCIPKILEDYDACGVDLVNTPTKHFSGNFWWSTTEHIKQLPRPQDLPCILSHRHKCEFWICSKPDGKYHSLHNSGIDVYNRHNTRYEKNQYEK